MGASSGFWGGRLEGAQPVSSRGQPQHPTPLPPPNDTPPTHPPAHSTPPPPQKVNGHFAASLDPLGLDQRPPNPELDPASYGFSEADMDRE